MRSGSLRAKISTNSGNLHARLKATVGDEAGLAGIPAELYIISMVIYMPKIVKSAQHT
jgi:hypothetical protein